jgi:hypothetical protein
MKNLLCAVVLVSLAATPAPAQSFGEQFPVTNTRYGAATGIPRLATNGRDFFLFWSADRKTRATHIDGNEREGHVVLDSSAPFDVAWTGKSFLAVTWRTVAFQRWIVGRLLDADARPAGAEFPVVRDGMEPHIAAGPESALVVYRGNTGEIRALLLGLGGKSLGTESRIIAAEGSTFAVAAGDSGFAIVIGNPDEIRAIALNRRGEVVADRVLARPAYYAYRTVAVASDGSNFLGMWCDNQEVASVRIDANATFGTPLVIDAPSWGASAPTAVWNGGGWSLSYESQPGLTSRARLVQLDWPAQRIVAREESATGIGGPTLAAAEGRIMAAWRPNTDGAASVVELPLATNQPRPATYAATTQTLLATAASAEATLIVWSETGDGRRSIHIGTQTNTGRWSERELTTRNATGPLSVLAASDGRNFAIVINDTRSKFIRLDNGGRPFGASLPLDAYPTLMAWNGTHYVLVGQNGGTEGLLVNASGELTATVALPGLDWIPTALVSDRAGGLLLAGEVMECPFILCLSVGLQGTRLGPDLHRIDDTNIIFSETSASLAGAAWNGSEYVLVWSDEEGHRVTRVPASRAEPIVTRNFSAPRTFTGASVTATGGGAVAVAGRVEPVLWHQTGAVVFLNTDGGVTGAFDMDAAAVLNGKPRLTPLPNGVAYVASSIQDGAPYDGTGHVMMAIARQPATPPRPEAPYVAARLEGANISVDWTAPAGALNGYRLEYRAGDGPWNELDDWFPTGTHHTWVPTPSTGTTFAVRMRAFNDGGTSPYSAVASTQPTRRRAVR